MEFSAQVSLEDMKLWKNAHSGQNRGNEKPQLQGLAQLASHKRHGGLVKVAEPATNTAETRAVKSYVVTAAVKAKKLQTGCR